MEIPGFLYYVGRLGYEEGVTLRAGKLTGQFAPECRMGERSLALPDGEE
jgi:hypothetical protein